MQHALVSGGAGFIGSHLCSALLDRGYAVTCVDNLQTGLRSNVSALDSRHDFIFIEHDVTRPLHAIAPLDFVFHLASPASVPDYLSRPLATLAVNSTGTLNLLDVAHRHSAHFLFASTSEIYGDPLVHPQPETYWGNVSSVGPRACYDESKRFGETLSMEYSRAGRADARIVRIFNTYGPHSRADDGRIVPNFITQALRGEPVTIYGTGAQTRSFCYVSDMVDGIMAAMFTPGTAGEVFNLGNGAECTVAEFAAEVAYAVGSTAGITHHALPMDDPTRRCPDIAKAEKLLGWSPVVDLATGLNLTIEWFRQLLRLPTPVS